MTVRRQKNLQKLARLFAVTVLLFASVAPVTAQQENFPELDGQLEPLKTQFNADVGKVRLILLLDPT